MSISEPLVQVMQTPVMQSGPREGASAEPIPLNLGELGVGRIMAIALLAGVALSVMMRYTSPPTLAQMHVAMDGVNCILAAVAAAQLLGIGQRTGERLALFVGLVLFFTSFSEAVHLVSSVLWADDHPAIREVASRVRPGAWTATAYTRAFGFLAAALLTRRMAVTPRMFSAALLLVTLVSLGGFVTMPAYGEGWLGMTRPTLLLVPLCWVAVAVMGWRARHEDRLMYVLGASALPFVLGHGVMLYSANPGDLQALVAHAGKASGYVFLVVVLNRIVSHDALAVLRAQRQLRERTMELEESHNQLSAEMVERERAEAGDRESRRRLRLALDAAQIGDWELDITTSTAYRSLKHDQIFGYDAPVPEWNFDIFIRHVHPDDRERVTESFRAGIERGKWKFATRIVRPDGTVRWIWAHGAVSGDGEGAPSRMYGMVLDVTELKEAQEELATLQARSEAMVSALAEGVVLFDNDGRIVSANEAATSILGRPRAEVAEQHATHAHTVLRGDGTPFPVDEQPSRVALRTGQPVRDVEVGVPTPDGRIRWLLVNAQPARDRSGRSIGAVASFFDITERKQIEEKIRGLNAELERRVEERTRALQEANHELESFSYSVSHDLRAPLRHVHGYVQLLTRATHGQLAPQATRYLAAITDASREMGQLIDDLLAFSRMGRSTLRADQVPLDELVRETIRKMEPDTRDRRIEWVIGPLPVVLGDWAMLRQALANLLQNAVKYTRTRDVARIEIGEAQGENGEAVIYVRDNGVGFDMTYVDKLFGVFQRLHRTSEFEGTGIGLASVKRIIARHGGRVWAESEQDRGATFFFTLKHAAPQTAEGDGHIIRSAVTYQAS